MLERPERRVVHCCSCTRTPFFHKGGRRWFPEHCARQARPQAPSASASLRVFPANPWLSASLVSARAGSNDRTATRDFSSPEPCLKKWGALQACRSWKITDRKSVV